MTDSDSRFSYYGRGIKAASEILLIPISHLILELQKFLFLFLNKSFQRTRVLPSAISLISEEKFTTLSFSVQRFQRNICPLIRENSKPSSYLLYQSCIRILWVYSFTIVQVCISTTPDKKTLGTVTASSLCISNILHQ